MDQEGVGSQPFEREPQVAAHIKRDPSLGIQRGFQEEGIPPSSLFFFYKGAARKDLPPPSRRASFFQEGWSKILQEEFLILIQEAFLIQIQEKIKKEFLI